MTQVKSRAIQAGAAAWIAGTAQFLAVSLIAQSAWRTPYSWATNAISDLGAVHCQDTGTANPPNRYVCSPLHAAMNTSFIALGVLLAGGALLTGPAWGKRAAHRTARSLLAVAGAGMILAGLMPEDVNLNLHVLGAFLIAGVGSIGFVLAALARSTAPVGRLRAVTLPLSLIALAATWLMFSHHTPVLGYGGMERAALYPLLCWTVIAGAYLLRTTTHPVRSRQRPAGHARAATPPQ